jgi:hypothetical protein
MVPMVSSEIKGATSTDMGEYSSTAGSSNAVSKVSFEVES